MDGNKNQVEHNSEDKENESTLPYNILQLSHPEATKDHIASDSNDNCWALCAI